jgi:hypothetical protein
MDMYVMPALTYLCFGALFVFLGWLMTRLLLGAGAPEGERNVHRWWNRFLASFTGALVLMSLFIGGGPAWITLVLVGFFIGVNSALVYTTLSKRAHRASLPAHQPASPHAERSV